MDIHLLVHNIGFIISLIMAISVIFFVIFNAKRSIANVVLIFGIISVCVFIISHLVGVNTSDPFVSQAALMFNLSMMPIGFFAVHAILAYLGKDKERKLTLILIYASGIFLTIFFIIYPDLFLLPSVPKMYFPEYYNPGILNWARLVYLFGICFPYGWIEIYSSRRHATGPHLRKQYTYMLLAFIITPLIGFIPNFLVYNIPIDPIWGTIFMVFFVSIFIYGSIKYDLFNIRIIAKQAFSYTVGIIVIGGFITILDYANRLIQTSHPSFPLWVAPLISAVFVVAIAAAIWKKLRENDLLKYEFVTTVTHKFRTPLTHIKWASENLLANNKAAPEDRIQIDYIRSADEKLVELTGLLMNISETENSDYKYEIHSNSLSACATEIINSLKEQFEMKKLHVTSFIDPDLMAEFDESRIKFVIQTFIENAVHYTPEGGSVNISLKRTDGHIMFSVTDSGIGISAEEIPRLFNKFYRGHNARLTDTEGMGIGLYMAKEIIARHNGKIWAASAGMGKGSTFSFSLKGVK